MVEQLRREFVQGPAFDLQGYLGMPGGRGGVGSGGRVEATQFPGGNPGSISVDMGGGGRGMQQAYQPGPMDSFLEGFGSGAGQSLATGIPEKILQFQQEQKRQKSMSALDRALEKVSPDDKEGKLNAILHAKADDETKQLRLQYENAKDQARAQKMQEQAQMEQQELARKQQEAYGGFLNQQAGVQQPQGNPPQQPGESPEYDKILQQGAQQAAQANQNGIAPQLPPVQQTDFRKFNKEQQKEVRQILSAAQRQANEEEKIRIDQEKLNLEQLKFAETSNKEMLKDWRDQYDTSNDSLKTIDKMRMDIESGEVGPHKIRSLMANSKFDLIRGLANPESQEFVSGAVKLIGNFKENFGGTITDAKLGLITTKMPNVARLPEGNLRLLEMAELSLMPKKLRYEEAIKLKKENGGVLPLGADWMVEERIQPKLRELDQKVDEIVAPLLTEEDLATGMFNVPGSQRTQQSSQGQDTSTFIKMTNPTTGETIRVHPEDVSMASEDGFQ